MSAIPPDADVAAWIADEVDAGAAAELERLRGAAAVGAADADAELADRFAGPLQFGTAGLRGPLRAGPNGMNRTVVRRAAAGLARWLTETGHAGATVVVGYDARHGSSDFARDSAAVFAAAGFRAVLLPRPLPTPVLAFAVRHLGAALGVMVTASHNPPQDNGYKVYAGDGAQIVSPTDRQIEAAIRAVGASRDIALDCAGVTVAEESLVSAYVDAVVALAAPGPRRLRIVHTALHGVGSATVRAVLTAAGFQDLIAVAQQEQPDPDFPTVPFPNPEEPGALDLAVALARERGADIVIANDPDADRCAVAVPVPGGASSDEAGGRASGQVEWRILRGDEVGALLADAQLRAGVRGTYATTIVSSSLLRAMAERHQVGFAETLTGFKWIMRAAPDLAFGYEEALGYAVAPHLVRDKDGISAALRIAELAAGAAAAGGSLPQRLDELAADYGRFATDQHSIRVEDPAVLTAIMQRLRDSPPATLLDAPVTVDDLLPEADVLRWRWPGGRVVIRPSGTEPKLKAYLEVVRADGSAAAAAHDLGRVRGEVAALLGG